MITTYKAERFVALKLTKALASVGAFFRVGEPMVITYGHYNL